MNYENSALWNNAQWEAYEQGFEAYFSMPPKDEYLRVPYNLGYEDGRLLEREYSLLECFEEEK